MLASLLAIKEQYVKCKRISLYSSDGGRYNQLMYDTKPKNLACNTFKTMYYNN
jgi:hypothetical protein